MPPISSISSAMRTAKAEHAIDKVREKFGKAAMVKGLVFDGVIEDDDDEETTHVAAALGHGPRSCPGSNSYAAASTGS